MPQYKRNAFHVRVSGDALGIQRTKDLTHQLFHQLFLRTEEFCIELKARQTQMASIFAAIQQVETRHRKEADTVEHRRKALPSFTRACYVKNMETLTKEF